MIVVDTNVIVALAMDSASSASARALYSTDSDWHAPQLWRSEFHNVLAGQMRTRHMSFEVARQLAIAAESAVRHEYVMAAEAVLHLVARSSCTAYDLEFVGLALQLGVTLVTLDRQVLREFPKVARPLA